jgi:hypothetical protein
VSREAPAVLGPGVARSGGGVGTPRLSSFFPLSTRITSPPKVARPHPAAMPLWIIGLGLGDEKDVTVKGAEAIAKCDLVFLEAYTSILGVSTETLVRRPGAAVVDTRAAGPEARPWRGRRDAGAARMTRANARHFGQRASARLHPTPPVDPSLAPLVGSHVRQEGPARPQGDGRVGSRDHPGAGQGQERRLPRRRRPLWVRHGGGPLFSPPLPGLSSPTAPPHAPTPHTLISATTHTDLLIRAQSMGISTHVVHNASIMNAVGACGLQLYSFGQTVSIPFFRTGWRPDSFYDKIAYNAGGGMHTLCLLGECRKPHSHTSSPQLESPTPPPVRRPSFLPRPTSKHPTHFHAQTSRFASRTSSPSSRRAA